MILRNLFVASLLAVVAQPVMAAEPADPPVKKDKRDPNAVRCRSEPMIGTLAKRTKICRTNAEWQRLSIEGNRDAADVVRGNGGCAGGAGCSGGN
ncbi:hypothetical protein ACFB49_35270 [Sphingomonas sp. DBB INV C78]|uniref:hypothetical protein n=1 Tax=Sphingomonas sp. DBB INV C78 TaxID=3349434 RepID=UPI0036D2B079